MRDRWDEACQALLVEAKHVSVELENYFLGTEHLAIAMALRPGSRLQILLGAHDVSVAEFVDLLYEASTPGPLMQAENMPLTPRIRHIVRRADDLCSSGGVEAITEVHLLGAMLGGGRGVFVRVAEVFDLDAAALLEELRPEIEGRASAPPPRAPRPHEATKPSQKPVEEKRRLRVSTGEKTRPSERPRGAEAETPRMFPMLPLGGNNPVLLDWGVVKKPSTTQKAARPQKEADGLLERLGRDLTAEARRGGLPRIIGRDNELDQLQRALCRANRNNPLVVGEAGVGKTALVEGLAQRIVSGSVPNMLRDVRIVEIPMAALTAETRFRGDLEERLLQLVEEVKANNVVLLIDDAEALSSTSTTHTDAGSVLRPFLARGDIRLIGTTSPAAFSRTIERDSALLRCFHPVRLAAPDAATVLRILQAVRERFEEFHQVRVPDVTLSSVIRQAAMYLKPRQMPDAAIDLLDEACVKAASMPTDDLDGVRDGEAEWPLVRPEEVAAVVSQRTGIPLETLSREERDRISHMEDELRRQVIGQDDAVRRVSERIRMFKAGFKEERRPLGVFLFLGPTGVGKTELAKAVSRFLFNSEEHLYRLDMSEYSEPHEVARLIGPPPGYVGYGEEGQLTAAVRRDPHCVVLLDEIEKAHPKVFDLFLQVFDEGRLTDGKGVTTDFTHAIIVLTSNIGADLWKAEKRIGFRQERAPVAARHALGDTVEVGSGDRLDEDEEEARRKRILATLKKTFRLEFLNRLDEVLLFRPLESDVIRAIARQMVGRWQARSAEQGRPFEIDDEVLDFLCKRGFEPELGARPMKRAIEQYLVGPLSRLVLDEALDDERPLVATVRGGRISFEQ